MIDVVFVVKDIIVIFRKIKIILILISFKRYFSHPEKSILNLSLGGLVIPGPDMIATFLFCLFISVS